MRYEYLMLKFWNILKLIFTWIQSRVQLNPLLNQMAVYVISVRCGRCMLNLFRWYFTGSSVFPFFSLSSKAYPSVKTLAEDAHFNIVAT
jgi:hypothetical protein